MSHRKEKKSPSNYDYKMPLRFRFQRGNVTIEKYLRVDEHILFSKIGWKSSEICLGDIQGRVNELI